MLVTVLPLVLLLEYGHSVTGIVGELIRVAGIERLTMAEILTKLVGTLIPIIEQLRNWGNDFRPRMEEILREKE